MRYFALVILLAIGVGAAALCLFTVKPWEKAIVLRVGKVYNANYEPGLNWKLPWPIDIVKKFDGRLLSVEAEPQRFLTSEKKDVIVDSFVLWRIQNVENYYTATKGGDERQAGILLYQKVNAALREEFGKRTVKEVVSGERGAIMDIVKGGAAMTEASKLGINIVDVRVSQIDLPAGVSDSVYQRMRAERERVARDFRSRGAEAAERIRARADRDRTVLQAEAYRDAESIRGEGDAISAEIYAKAYGNDAEFYSFTRSLNAYRASFGNKKDVMLLEPDSDFFRFFKDSAGK